MDIKQDVNAENGKLFSVNNITSRAEKPVSRHLKDRKKDIFIRREASVSVLLIFYRGQQKPLED